MQHKFRRTRRSLSAPRRRYHGCCQGQLWSFNPKQPRIATPSGRLLGRQPWSPCARRLVRTNVRFSRKTFDAIVARISQRWLYIHLPTTPARWRKVESGFAQKCGFLGVVGALDGTLIRIQHLADFEGSIAAKISCI
ncbi:hypothetical protein GQ600_3576 [Phytophthora cactorum]|nr:hypothetical protein GQ600_3576 [Phytophthora cactorum]